MFPTNIWTKTSVAQIGRKGCSHAGARGSTLVARAIECLHEFRFETGIRYCGHTREKSERRLRQYTGLQYVDPTR
jgi:hypothetical protein